MASRAAKVTLNDVRVKDAKPDRYPTTMIGGRVSPSAPSCGTAFSRISAFRSRSAAPRTCTSLRQTARTGNKPGSASGHIRVALGDARKGAAEALGTLESRPCTRLSARPKGVPGGL